MRKICISVLAVLAAAMLPAMAQEHLSERVYISTDRDVYVAGDEMFISAFCLDMSRGGLSSVSRTAYIEIVSSEGPVQTSKVALSGGRGGGVISLQNTIPTGEYRLVAYTAQCFNEDGYDFLEGARTLSIINPFTTARSASGVEIVSDDEYAGRTAAPLPSAGSVRMDASGALTLTNTSDLPVTLSVSVSHKDGILPPADINAVSFAAGATRGRSFTQRRDIDYEGEIIRARLVGAEDLSTIEGNTVYLSVPGRATDVYSSSVSPEGIAEFYTRNVNGRTDVVLDAGSVPSGVHLEIVQPFAGVSDPGLQPLPLCSGLQEDIRMRSLAMQVDRAVRADTLYARLPVPESSFFAADSVEYILDDYTRFPLMEELFIEFITEVRARRISGGGRELIVALRDDYRPNSVSQLPALVLLDGVPVADHNLILEYDPLLVERIVVYPHTCFIGGRRYPGVVSFSTYRHDLPSFPFGESSRVVDFQGTCTPVVSWLPGSDPDLRQTLLWHPLVELAPGETRVLDYLLPSYDGAFEAVAEGFDSSGAPQYVRVPLSR